MDSWQDLGNGTNGNKTAAIKLQPIENKAVSN
jgi:hypothetical protein